MKKVAKILAAVVLTLVLVLTLVKHSELIKRNVALRDSLAYWAAARLLIHHQNPYSHDAVLHLERQNGYTEDRPLVLRTPPWSLLIVLPLGLLNPLWAWVAWLSLLFLCLTVGLRVCSRLYRAPDMPQNSFTVLAYTFAPVAACLVSGQMGLVLMLGVILFLHWEAKKPFLAGMALILPFAKPHLLSLFWLALFVWILTYRKRKVAFGFATAFAAATLLSLAFDPRVFRDYQAMLQGAAIGNEFIPALSGVLRLLFFRRFFWIQFVPMALGVIWTLWFLQANWDKWIWKQHGPALLVVAVLTTPYEWLSDETVLLPAMLQGLAFVLAIHTTLRVRTKLVLLAFAMLDALLLLILRFKIPFATGIYFWSSLVWFGWYFYARRLYRRALTSLSSADMRRQSAS